MGLVAGHLRARNALGSLPQCKGAHLCGTVFEAQPPGAASAQVSATVNYIQSDRGIRYPACPFDFNGRMCQKKMADQGTGEFFCERCGKVGAVGPGKPGFAGAMHGVCAVVPPTMGQ